MSEFLKRVPGFRSGSKLKKLIAGIVYFFVFLSILALVIPVPPTLTLEPSSPTNKSSTSISGETFSGKPVYLLQAGKMIQSTTADSDGIFFFALNDLGEGSFTYTVQACDSEDKKQCVTENILIVVDMTPPLKPVANPPNQLPEEDSIPATFTGVAEANAQVIAKVGDKELPPVSADSEGNFSVRANLDVGKNTLTFIAIDAAGNESEQEDLTVTFNPSRRQARVTRVIDGDTVELEDGKRVRYIGIDTPETGDCYWTEATNKNKKLVEGKIVTLLRDVSETDKYGRLLRYVWVGDTFINDVLVRKGYANASSYPPDVKYQDQFREAEREARDDDRGLWGEVCVEPEPQPAPTSQTAPEPEPSDGNNCHPSYTNVCIPIGASDYDCAGGSGNGPNYISGPIYVNHNVSDPDPHRLDRDKDGVGCEN